MGTVRCIKRLQAGSNINPQILSEPNVYAGFERVTLKFALTYVRRRVHCAPAEPLTNVFCYFSPDI